MNTFERFPERAMELASRVGDGIRDAVPDRAVRWVETGAALGALKSGSRVATKFARRNPTLLVAAAAGAGLLWYAARRRARNLDGAGNEAIEGSSRRIEARRETTSAARRRHARADANQASDAVPGS
ncbi:MAG TPA: hypothetical protein VHL61_02695 [Luteimonas sp.]|jgi:hypothetical protein|nr:hypothetical protein [Luteimonas sp.]